MSNSITVAHTVSELRATLQPRRRKAESIGLVPTMGALHDGHLSLIRRARERCDCVVVSIFVNPSQFERADDLQSYPRRPERDLELAKGAGADVVFAPDLSEVYPEGFATQVSVSGPSDGFEGAARGSGHFQGVATIVAKLFNMAAPDVAYFGQKDAQQVAVIRRLVADLNLTLRLEICPTMREPDGLALSSRNALLSPEDRRRAVGLHEGLAAAEDVAASGERSAEALISLARNAMQTFGVEPDYLAVVDPRSFEPVEGLDQPALLVVAAQVGSVRLIDNTILEPSGS